MHYFFGHVDLANNLTIIENEEAHHCATVLRLKEGDIIGILTLEKDNNPIVIYKAELIRVHKKECQAIIKDSRIFEPPSVKIHLIISPPKSNERLEWLVEKAVELQAFSLLFVKSKRCIRSTLNIDRLKKIALAASKQAANPLCPEVKFFTHLQDLSRETLKPTALYLLLHCKESDRKIKINTNFLEQIKEKKYPDIYVFVGPEGDWTVEEINFVLNKFSDTLEINLGDTRLRTETAAIDMLCVLRTLF